MEGTIISREMLPDRLRFTIEIIKPKDIGTLLSELYESEANELFARTGG